MTIALITGASGLIGSEAVQFFANKGWTPVGIDNDMRARFFGDEASTRWKLARLKEEVPGYIHHDEDIRDEAAMQRVFSTYGNDIGVIIHAAAQPSHDWAATAPMVDFSVNAVATLLLLEMTRKYAPKAPFVFTSTNNVYGDAINYQAYQELETRWELVPEHPYFEHGIDEHFSIDQSSHTIFGASKVAADVMVQEYGRYFGLYTGCFRGGCLTGPAHSGTELHGFLSYLMKCTLTGKPYTIMGWKAKQVRDNIHSYDLVNMFWHFAQKPRCGEVYNAGGSRASHCSMLEAIALSEKIAGKKLDWRYNESNRQADHKWWVSDLRKFRSHYPEWELTRNLEQILVEIHDSLATRV